MDYRIRCGQISSSVKSPAMMLCAVILELSKKVSKYCNPCSSDALLGSTIVKSDI